MNHISHAISTVSYGVVDRAINVIDIIPVALECVKFAGEAVIGVVATPFSAITCGRNERLNKQANLTGQAQLILPTIFKGVMSVINPNAKYVRVNLEIAICTIVIKIFGNLFSQLKNSPSLFNRQVVLRALIVFAIPVYVIACIADTILAVPVVITSLATVGIFPELNELAFTQLQAPLFSITVLSMGLRGLVNPYYNCGKD